MTSPESEPRLGAEGRTIKIEDLIVLCGASALIGLLPAAIANSKGHGFFEWWIFGAALFIVALPAAILIKQNSQELEQRELEDGQHRKCPFCAEIVRMEAVVCKHCGRDIPLAPTPVESRLVPKYLFVPKELQDNYLALTKSHLSYKSTEYHLSTIRGVSVDKSPGGYYVIRIVDSSGDTRDFGFWKDLDVAVRWMQAIKHNQQAFVVVRNNL